METQPTFNADLARQVLAYIREHPTQHLQTTYVEPAEGSDLHPYDDDAEPDVLDVAQGVKPTPAGEYRCMTTACIAGWAVALAGPAVVRKTWDSLGEDERGNEPWFATGRRLLGMTREEANEVFMEFNEEAALEHLEGMIQAAAV